MPVWLLLNWRLILVGVSVVILAAFSYRLGGSGARADLARAKASHAAQVAEWQRLSAEAAAAALRRQQALQLTIDTAREDLTHAKAEIADRDAKIVRVSLDAGRLRDKLAAYASGAGSQDSIAACQQRAGSLADLLAEGAGLLAEGTDLYRQAARAHDERAAEVNALLKAWPRTHAENH
jgi:hypothetical protein